MFYFGAKILPAQNVKNKSILSKKNINSGKNDLIWQKNFDFFVTFVI
jgi:hypothetical protein